MIWALGALVAAAAIGGLAAPWWWPSFAQRQSLRRRTANVTAYRGRLEELEADAQAAVVAPETVAAVKEELAARLLQDTDAPAPAALGQKSSGGLLALAALGLLAFAAAWYAVAGTWRTQALVELNRTHPELARAQGVDQMIERLRRQLAKNPDDAESWAWLARSYSGRGNYTEAAEAFAKAGALKGGQDPDLLVDEGEALASAQNRAMTGAPAERFSQALALAPDHTRGLWFAGIAALQAGDDRAAVTRWERLLAQEIPEDTRATLEHSIARLRERSGLKAPATAEAPAPAAPMGAASSALALKVDVSVAPELAGQVGAGDALFVFAQDAAGPPMPLAVQRLSAAQLPAQVTLDDSNSMTAGRKLSSVGRWRVVARVSRSGNAIPQPGDLEGSVEVGKADAGKPVKVVISRLR